MLTFLTLTFNFDISFLTTSIFFVYISSCLHFWRGFRGFDTQNYPKLLASLGSQAENTHTVIIYIGYLKYR